MDDGTMNLDQRRFGRLVSRHALLILAVVVLGALLGAAVAFTRQASYTATTQLQVADPLTLNDVLGINQGSRSAVTISDQIAVLGSDAVKDQVKSQVGATNFTTTFSTPGSGQVLTILVKANNSSLAGRVATAYDQVYLNNLATRNAPLFTTAISQLSSQVKSVDSQVAVLTDALKNASSTSVSQVQATVGPQIQQLLSSRSDLNKQLGSVTLSQKVTPSGDAQVVSPASTTKDGSNLTLVAYGGIAGLLIGLLLAGVREVRFGRIVDESDVDRYGLPLVARIGTSIPKRFRTAPVALASGNDVPNYREAAVLLAPPHAKESLGRWLVTSADRDGLVGATLAGRLARQIALMGRRVIIVDTAAASQTRVQDVGSHPGLAEVLRGEVPIEQGFAVDPGSNVFVMAPGKGFSALPEPLASRQFAAILDSLGHHFDLIIVTGAPFERSADAYVLGPLADRVIIALQRGVTRRSTLEDATAQLGNVLENQKASAVLFAGRARGRNQRPTRGAPAIEDVKVSQRAPHDKRQPALALHHAPVPGTSS